VRRSAGSVAASAKPIETWPISVGAFTGTVTIWYARPSCACRPVSPRIAGSPLASAASIDKTLRESAIVAATGAPRGSVKTATSAPMRSAWFCSASVSVDASPTAIAARKP